MVSTFFKCFCGPKCRVVNVLVDHIQPYRGRIIVVFAAMLAQSLLLVPLPWLQGRVIDALVSHDNWSSNGFLYELAVPALIFPLLCLIGRCALNWFSAAQMNRISLEAVRSLTEQLHGKLQRLSLGFFARCETGELMARMTNDVGTLLIFVNASSLQLIADLVLAAGVVCLLFRLSMALSLVSVAVLPLFLWNHRRHAGRISQLSEKLHQRTAELYAGISDRLSAMRVIRAFGMERQELADFGHRLDRQSDDIRQSLWSTLHLNLGAVLIGGIGTAMLICLAAILVQQGTLTAGQAVAFASYIGLLYPPLIRLTQSCSGLSATNVAADRIAALLDEPEPERAGEISFVGPVRGELQFDHVTFGYSDNDPNVLSAVNLSIAAGSTVGICGASGSGKSTLLALVPRLYDLPPGGGRILLDGMDLRRLAVDELRREILLVPQHSCLFEGTLRYNLLYASKSKDESAIWRALRAVEMAEFVQSLPMQLNTWVGERGCSLSGGQRQRIALARALLCEAEILLLDDCTSALDALTEARVHRQLADSYPDKTRVVVSHKSEFLKTVDKLVVLEQGHVIYQGDPKEFLAQQRIPCRTAISPRMTASSLCD